MKTIALLTVFSSFLQHVIICGCINVIVSRLFLLENLVLNYITLFYFIFALMFTVYKYSLFFIKISVDDNYIENFYKLETTKTLRKIFGKTNERKK